MFDDQEGISLGREFLQGIQKACVVAGMKSDRRLIQDVEDATEIRSELCCKTDALRLAAAEGFCGTVELEVIEADPPEELKSLLEYLISNPDKMNSLKESINKVKTPNASYNIARLAIELTHS